MIKDIRNNLMISPNKNISSDIKYQDIFKSNLRYTSAEYKYS